MQQRDPYINDIGVRIVDGKPDPPYPKATPEQERRVAWIQGRGLPLGWVRFVRYGWDDVQTMAGPMLDVSDPAAPQTVYGKGECWQAAFIALFERCKQARRLRYRDGFQNRNRYFTWNPDDAVFDEENP